MTTPFDEWRAAKRKEARELALDSIPKGRAYFAKIGEGYDLLDLLEAALRKAESGTDARVA